MRRLIPFFLALLLTSLPQVTLVQASPTFTDIDAGIIDLGGSSAVWGDFDNDGDLDLLVVGDSGEGLVSRIYRNDLTSFVDIDAGLPGIRDGAVHWGDYDNDGDLDLFLCGSTDQPSSYISRVYRNDSGSFVDINAGLPGVRFGEGSWVDYDNDGDLDLLLTGQSATGDITRLYRNDSGNFADAALGLPGANHSSVDWGDYDSDGDLDLLLTGRVNSQAITRVYRNNSGGFTDIESQFLVGVWYGSAVWGDYNNDGKLDILLTGYSDLGEITRIYRNYGYDIFIDIEASLPSLAEGKAAWGDYDNDGDLDALLVGSFGATRSSRIFRNDSGSFTDSQAGLPGVARGAAAWGDYDNDGDLDILLSGNSGFAPLTRIFRSDGVDPNTPAVAPANLSTTQVGSLVTFSWDAAVDADTPAAGLTYNLRIGTSSGGDEAMSSMADASSGYRRLVRPGNVGSRLSWTVLVPPGSYFWSVQTIDGAYMGSPFAAQSSFRVSEFTDIHPALPAVRYGAAAWGDYDNDGDLDLLLTGSTESTRITGLYRNEGGNFSDAGVGMLGVDESAAAWGDYDNDGDLDLLLSGNSGSEYITRIYRNSSGSFTDIRAGLPGVASGSLAWGDYDNDGDLDVLLTGDNAAGPVARIFRNDAGSFTSIMAGLAGVINGSATWGDYDSDGDLDILLTGLAAGSQPISRVYRNVSGSFTDIGAGLPGAYNGAAEWGDYDSDGDLDFLLSGKTETGATFSVYRNDAGNFVATEADLPSFKYNSAASWGDYDNDGDLDLLVCGDNGSGPHSYLYRNDGGTFTNAQAGLTGLAHAAVAWGDYNHDGGLDILISGNTFLSGPAIGIYRNGIVPRNTLPVPPENLTTLVQGHAVTFAWDPASDLETPVEGLSYNLRIGTTPGGNEISSVMADEITGYRRVVQPGNAQEKRSRIIELEPGAYYWSVQAIDGSFAGSGFAQERTFRLTEFTNIQAGLSGVQNSSLAWGDFDGDGDLDIAMTGDTGFGTVSRIYRNDSGSFIDIGAGLPGTINGSVAWGDYDNDGDLDLLLCGGTSSGNLTEIYRNESGLFRAVDAGLPAVQNSAVAWGDYDNDGDLDLLLSGTSSTGSITSLLRNDTGTFVDVSAGLPGISSGSVAWGDYDKDGDLDLLLTGLSGQASISRVYRNQSGTFTDIRASLLQVRYGSAKWGDYDSDGDLDILLAGDTGSELVTRVYRNDAGTFHDSGASLDGTWLGSAEWGDYDNDGDLDILLSGDASEESLSRIYRNDSGSFTGLNSGLPAISLGAAVWGDYDNDGDLDILLSGKSGTETITRIYRSAGWPPNTPPTAPELLSTQINKRQVVFSWDAATDMQTPRSGLSYNLRVGTTPGGNEVVSGMADGATGCRRIPKLGNAQQSVSWELTLAPGKYYWSVQALDDAWAGSEFANEQSFLVRELTELGAGLPGVKYGSAKWGDYDNDGDLDLILTGDAGTEFISRIYRNDSGNFTHMQLGLPGVEYSSVAWGDYDNDGDLDLLLTGDTGTSAISRIFRNDAGVLVDSGVILPGVYYGSVAWGDYDNDGDLDFILTGYSGYSYLSRVYRNDSGSFTDLGAGMPGMTYSAVAWGDYDDDGDLDIALTGITELGSISRIYRNDGGSFTDSGAALENVYYGSVEWGDYDNDGDLDILVSGRSASGYLTRVYRNDAGQFYDINAKLPGLWCSTSAWGDFENDGDLDILLMGSSGTSQIARIYANDGGTFSDIEADLPPMWLGSAAWGDYDNDGDLDLVLVGKSGTSYLSRIYRNEGVPTNAPPATPMNLSATYHEQKLILSWDASTDEQTPAQGLSYNLRIGTTPGGDEISSAMADESTGYRRVVSWGNAGNRTTRAIHLPFGQYYWTVQAIDGAFAGSPFAAEQSFMAATGVEDPPKPKIFALAENVPNPFNPATTIRYELATPCNVTLRIYDARGRLVTTLDEGRRTAGSHEAMWRGEDKNGRQVGSGVYFYRLDAGSFHESRRMVKLK